MKKVLKLSCFLLVLVLMVSVLPVSAHASNLPNNGCSGSDTGIHNWQVYDFAAYPTCTEKGNSTYYVCPYCDHWFIIYAGRVIDMAQYLVREGGLKFLTAHLETLELQG